VREARRLAEEAVRSARAVRHGTSDVATKRREWPPPEGPAAELPAFLAVTR